MRDSPFRVLVICTGNLCRSPMAERLLAESAAGPIAEGSLSVVSAGTRAISGRDMHPLAAQVLGERGVASGGFRSSPLNAAAVVAADLVLTMERSHRAEVVQLVPRAVRRTFTLLEFASLVAGALPSAPSAEGPRERAAALTVEARLRRGVVPVPTGPAADVADPIRGALDDFRACLRVIEGAVHPFFTQVLGSQKPGAVPPRAAGGGR